MADLEVCVSDLSSLLHFHQEARANGNGVFCYSASVPLLKGPGSYMETRSGCSSRAGTVALGCCQGKKILVSKVAIICQVP